MAVPEPLSGTTNGGARRIQSLLATPVNVNLSALIQIHIFACGKRDPASCQGQTCSEINGLSLIVRGTSGLVMAVVTFVVADDARVIAAWTPMCAAAAAAPSICCLMRIVLLTTAPSYLRLHRVTRHTISKDTFRGKSWTEGDDMKACAQDVAELERWARERVKGELDPCKKCKPL